MIDEAEHRVLTGQLLCEVSVDIDSNDIESVFKNQIDKTCCCCLCFVVTESENQANVRAST